MQLAEFVRGVDLFSSLPGDAIDELVQRGSTRQAGPERVLVEQGAPDSGLQIVLEGDVSVEVDGRQVSVLTGGDYFGEISLIDGEPRSATVVAGHSGAKVFTISPLAFSSLMDADPRVARLLLPVLTARIRRAEAALAGTRS